MAGIDEHVPNVGFAGATLCIPIAWLATDKIIALLGTQKRLSFPGPLRWFGWARIGWVGSFR